MSKLTDILNDFANNHNDIWETESLIEEYCKDKYSDEREEESNNREAEISHLEKRIKILEDKWEVLMRVLNLRIK